MLRAFLLSLIVILTLNFNASSSIGCENDIKSQPLSAKAHTNQFILDWAAITIKQVGFNNIDKYMATIPAYF